MALFGTTETSQPYAKIGFMGEAGTGKTHTASLFAIGLVQYLREHGHDIGKRPVFMLDTEKSAAWVRPLYAAAGVDLVVEDKTRAFADLVPALRIAEERASVLIIDSITHFWLEIQQTYMAKRRRERLEFQDWAVIKRMWREFTDLYVFGNLHCILCGRQGYQYDQAVNDQGKKEITKVGVKMKAEGELGYEPSLLVWMERAMDLAAGRVMINATVLKDRSRTIDGQSFENPTFASFLPHVAALSLGATHAGVDLTRTSEDAVPTEGRQLDPDWALREVWLERLSSLLVKHFPERTPVDMAFKHALLLQHFGTKSWKEISQRMALPAVVDAVNALHLTLEKVASPWVAPGDPAASDVAVDPADDLPLAPGAVSDLELIARDIEATLRKCTAIGPLSNAWRLHARDWAALDDELKARVRVTFDEVAAKFAPPRGRTSRAA